MTESLKAVKTLGRKINIFVLPILLLFQAACTPPDISENATKQDDKGHADAIAWFPGSIKEAFDFAKENDKPLYFYWGAVWCPPCQEIKNTVFKSNEFISLSHLFVPVYLDGDTDRAQAWGEKFGVKGYPTMIIFSPDGKEITRIPGGIDISRYNSILALSLQGLIPTRDLLIAARKDIKQLNESDYVQLAFYSWGQDFDSFPDNETPDLFLILSDGAREKSVLYSDPKSYAARKLLEASTRLYFQYLLKVKEKLKANESEQTQANTDAMLVDIEMLASRIEEVMGSDQLILANWDYLAYQDEEILSFVSEKKREQIATRWANSLLALKSSDSLSTSEKLAAWIPTLRLNNAKDNGLSEAFRTAFMKDMEDADRITTNSFARQGVVSQMNYLYQNAGMADRAESMLLAELERSNAPYYFMSSLSSLAEKKGNITEALEWRKKSWETSTGAATRFQWGANYVRALIRLSPEDKSSITRVTQIIIDESGGENELFSGRNFRILKSLTGVLKDWAGNQQAEVEFTGLMSSIRKICGLTGENTDEQTNCQAILDTEKV